MVHEMASSASSAQTPAEARGPLESDLRQNDLRRWRPALSARATYAALDLGTNNCRLLIARPAVGRSASDAESLRIIDAFSRIVRLGEGLTRTGRLGEAAIERTIEALDICRDKMDRRGVTRARLIATEACRAAANSQEFIQAVAKKTGLHLEIVDRQTEARLAAVGCGSLADPQARGVVLFDIGGGSTEVVWLSPKSNAASQGGVWRPEFRPPRIWTSIDMGVVSLAERYGGRAVDREVFETMAEKFGEKLKPFVSQAMRQSACEKFHLLGASGTVTTVAGVHLDLARYDRRRVDGLWLSADEADRAIDRLRAMDYQQRVANGCIGNERADLVLAGCAILEAIRRAFPARRLRVADRGLREGVLIELMRADGWFRRRPPR